MTVRKQLNQIGKSLDEIDSSIGEAAHQDQIKSVNTNFEKFTELKEMFDDKFYSRPDAYDGDEVFIIESLKHRFEKVNEKFAKIM